MAYFNSLSDSIFNNDVISSVKTDQSARAIGDVDDRVKGPGIWKVICSLLSARQYFDKINRLIPALLQEGKEHLSDAPSA